MCQENFFLSLDITTIGIWTGWSKGGIIMFANRKLWLAEDNPCQWGLSSRDTQQPSKSAMQVLILGVIKVHGPGYQEFVVTQSQVHSQGINEQLLCPLMFLCCVTLYTHHPFTPWWDLLLIKYHIE